MANKDIGNNWYIGDSSVNGEGTDEIGLITNAVFIDRYDKSLSVCDGTQWAKFIHSTVADKLIFQVTRQVPLTNIGTSYVDIFSSFYQGYPQGIDCNGYTKLGFILLWNKNGGTGIHDLRVITVDDEDPQVMFNTESVRIANGWPQDGLPSGPSRSYNIPIPSNLRTFRGEVKVQAKSTVATDDPIFDACNLYVLR